MPPPLSQRGYGGMATTATPRPPYAVSGGGALPYSSAAPARGGHPSRGYRDVDAMAAAQSAAASAPALAKPDYGASLVSYDDI